MMQYKIFKNPSGSIEAVKQGWSWPAFFFTWLWAMVKKQWAIGFATLFTLFILGTPLVFVAANLADVILTIASIVLAIIFGINGNSWRRENLISRGYDHVDTVTAANPEGAVALYLKAVNTRG